MPFCALLGVGVVLLPTVWVFHVVSGVNKLGPHRTSSGRDEPSRLRLSALPKAFLALLREWRIIGEERGREWFLSVRRLREKRRAFCDGKCRTLDTDRIRGWWDRRVCGS
ncbi:hypothetical protein TNCT_367721 [Trichonephila clavata]|uniref:Uncharacterized protein n=1 Tax=Trichonephila clavata TaxID=2740835 RepID=A0A8X6JL67_TRICU|nr:hypothetical protein TNCT_367721 [Trichonephila clavata]